MKIITISKKKLKYFSKYKLNSKISNKEGIKYRVEGVCLNLEDKNFIVKKFGEDIYTGLYKKTDFKNKNIAEMNPTTSKLYTIATLADYKEQIGIEEICIPQVLVEIEEYEMISYFLIPEIENSENLGIILKDTKISSEEKINYLYQAGKILDRILGLDLDIKINIGDLREYNFIVDQAKKVHIVDTDSFYLHIGYLPESYYLPSMCSAFREQPKKYRNKINDNTDIWCYISMIFNTLLDNKIYILEKEDYFNYLKYLKYLGFKEDILLCFKKIFSEEENKNPYQYLDQIPLDKLEETNNRSYKKYKRAKNLF